MAAPHPPPPQCTYVAAAIGAFAALLGGWCHADSSSSRDVRGVRLERAELRAVVCRILRARHFWLAALSESGVGVIKRAIETGLGALFFYDTSSREIVSQATSTQLAMVWSAGLALSVFAGA